MSASHVSPPSKKGRARTKSSRDRTNIRKQITSSCDTNRDYPPSSPTFANPPNHHHSRTSTRHFVFSQRKPKRVLHTPPSLPFNPRAPQGARRRIQKKQKKKQKKKTKQSQPTVTSSTDLPRGPEIRERLLRLSIPSAGMRGMGYGLCLCLCLCLL